MLISVILLNKTVLGQDPFAGDHDEWESDDVSLLQGEVVKTQRAKEAASAGAKAAAQPEQQSFCAGAEKAPLATEIGADLVDEVLTKAADPKVNAGEDAGASFMLRSCLLAMTFLLFVDGARRWHQEQQQEPNDQTKAPTKKKKTTDVSVDGRHQLIEAALAGDAELARALIAAGAPTDGADVWGSTLLHAAAKGGSAKLVSKLLQLGANVDEADICEDTPLHSAARAGQADACEVLIAFGADVNAVNAQGSTPLVLAVSGGYEAARDLLLARGAAAGDASPAAGKELKELLRECGGEEDPDADSMAELEEEQLQQED